MLLRRVLRRRLVRVPIEIEVLRRVLRRGGVIEGASKAETRPFAEYDPLRVHPRNTAAFKFGQKYFKNTYYAIVSNYQQIDLVLELFNLQTQIRRQIGNHFKINLFVLYWAVLCIWLRTKHRYRIWWRIEWVIHFATQIKTLIWILWMIFQYLFAMPR